MGLLSQVWIFLQILALHPSAARKERDDMDAPKDNHARRVSVKGTSTPIFRKEISKDSNTESIVIPETPSPPKK